MLGKMKILAVDDEQYMLDRLCRCIREAESDVDLIAYKSSSEALHYIQEHEVDVVFLDIQMRKMTGMDLARELKLRRPSVNIIFVTGYHDYIYQAVSEIRCSGYLVKPVTTEQVITELHNLRHPIAGKASTRLRIQCFGNFEVFVDGKVLNFSLAKSKELLAYLVDRSGAMCTNREIAAILWEDDEEHYSYLKKIKRDLMNTLKAVNCEEIINSQRGRIGIARNQIECDYYQWLEGTAAGINAYHGEYMMQYSWAEVTKPYLE